TYILSGVSLAVGTCILPSAVPLSARLDHHERLLVVEAIMRKNCILTLLQYKLYILLRQASKSDIHSLLAACGGGEGGEAFGGHPRTPGKGRRPLLQAPQACLPLLSAWISGLRDF